MPVCPNCEYEYKEGVTTCPDCGFELVAQDEFEKHLTNPEDWDVVYTCEENYQAEMVKSNLEGAGIKAIIIPQNDRNFPAGGDFSVIKLVVKKKDFETAKQIIEDINSNISAEEPEE